MVWIRETDPSDVSPTDVAFRSDDRTRRLWLRVAEDEEPGWVIEDLVANDAGVLEPRCEEYIPVSDAVALAPEVGAEVLFMTRSLVVRLRRAGRLDDAAALERELADAERETEREDVPGTALGAHTKRGREPLTPPGSIDEIASTDRRFAGGI
jgi:hypothetical protein